MADSENDKTEDPQLPAGEALKRYQERFEQEGYPLGARLPSWPFVVSRDERTGLLVLNRHPNKRPRNLKS